MVCKISNSLGVLGSSSDIIHIDSYVLIDIAMLSHPDIWLGLAWRESHVSEAIGKVFMPTKARGPEAVKHLEDDEGMSLQLTKFRTHNDVDLLLSFSFKISIANVSCLTIQVIELSKEDKEVQAMKRNNTRIDTV